jgi:hypothetical protein
VILKTLSLSLYERERKLKTLSYLPRIKYGAGSLRKGED